MLHGGEERFFGVVLKTKSFSPPQKVSLNSSALLSSQRSSEIRRARRGDEDGDVNIEWRMWRVKVFVKVCQWGRGRSGIDDSSER